MHYPQSCVYQFSHADQNDWFHLRWPDVKGCVLQRVTNLQEEFRFHHLETWWLDCHIILNDEALFLTLSVWYVVNRQLLINVGHVVMFWCLGVEDELGIMSSTCCNIFLANKPSDEWNSPEI